MMQKSGNSLHNFSLSEFVCQEQKREDAMVSLNHRMALLETNMNSKIERDECMRIIENKASSAQLNRLFQQLNEAMAEEFRKNEERSRQQSQAAFHKLSAKLGTKAHNNARKKQAVKIIPLQDFYLKSDEMMFSLIIDEISELKKEYERVQKLVTCKNQINVNIHNEICQKIQQLELELEFQQQQQSLESSNSKQGWKPDNKKRGSNSRPCEYQYNAETVNKIEGPASANSIQLIRLDNLTRIVEAIQSQMTLKINIRDVLPLVQRKIEHVADTIQDIKSYTEGAVDSTKKILVHQSEINQQLCLASRAAWWQSFQSACGFAVWSKEIVNMVPEMIELDLQCNEVRIAHQGTYIVKLLSKTFSYPNSIVIGDQEYELHGNELLVTIPLKNSLIRVPSDGNQLLMIIHKV